jgi:hypothetical protein
MSPELRQAVREFRQHPTARQCRTSDGADGLCGFVAPAFATFLIRRGITARPVFLVGVVGRTAPSFPLRVHDGDYITHAVVLVDGQLLDWSARQYDAAASWPEVVKPWGNLVVEWNMESARRAS